MQQTMVVEGISGLKSISAFNIFLQNDPYIQRKLENQTTQHTTPTMCYLF